ncbi:MAG: S8 family peptidase [Candidatus Natronoplasma sp.]
MKNKIYVFTIIILLLTSGLTVTAHGSIAGFERNYDEGSSDLNSVNEFSENDQNEKQITEYCKNSILVQVASSSENSLRPTENEKILQNKVDNLLDFVDGRTSRLYPSFNMAEIKLPENADVMSSIEVLTRKDEVVNAEPNYLIETSEIPNDPGYGSLWAMDNIDAPKAWNTTTGSDEIVVPVIDTGIDYNHPDLKDNIWTSEEGNHGYNAVNDSDDPMDDQGHGTHVAGTIGAVGNNDSGLVGVNWNVSLMGVKILDSEGSGNIGDAISGLEYVLERKKDGENIIVTSNSWWGDARSEMLYEAIEQHNEEGILFVTAAGNEGLNNGERPSYPANYDLPNIISVAATDKNDDLARFSNYGKRSVHVGAPGVEINSTKLDGEYGHASGTSMAVPHVSGLAALLSSHNSSHDHNNLKNIILSSVDTSDSLRNRTLVDGRINAYSSITQYSDPEDIRFWVHQPYTTVQWREEIRMMISLNDGVNPIQEANVWVEFSTRQDDIDLVDDGSGKDHIANDGYYTGKWKPESSGEVNLTINVESEEFEEKMTKNVTVDVRLVHRETAQKIQRGILSLLRALFRAIFERLGLTINVSDNSIYQYKLQIQKSNRYFMLASPA